ncbi:efflux RND transporter permease subunit [Roseateles asaccharophilus]|uniref:Multidrug efflux pump subunit AcrB n=1 Tax=Roseateles asaccharophilus TaxID=582607 RepID=A0ABU2A430_9BURK|nr:efflux RND transporter permease subunit [Roseateles asaccharophilus]MDR7331899.1 multidrug efflux pump subunit AcrB [Roseateles asaccharophilus]
MSFNVSSWAIRNPVPGILLFALLTVAGFVGFSAMKVQNFPDMTLPVVTITASLPGASPSQLESEIARKIENALATVQGVKHVNSTLSESTAHISVSFQLEKSPQEAVDDVRDAVARVRSDLPAHMRDPIIKKAALADSPVLTYTVASPRMDEEALSWFVDHHVSKTLLAVPGVGTVSRVGGVTREVRVELDPARLLALKASAADISRQLHQVQQESAGGRADLGGAEQQVRAIATVLSAEELAAVELVLGDGRSVRLDEVATVVDGVAEPRSAARLGGRPVVGFEVRRARGAGDLEVAEGVRAAVATLKASQPWIDVVEAIDHVQTVQQNYDGSMALLYEGAALAVLVVLLFLRDWRSTLVAAVALPLSAIPTFAVMHLMGFTINTVTLLSLSLVIGVLVDDAIVEIENIERHLRMGKSPHQAAMEAAEEIGLAVIATTFTLIAVFLPTAFMSGAVGKVFVQFGWTAVIAVFFSLLVARMLTPMMAAYLLKAPGQLTAREPRWVAIYLGWAGWCLRHRALTIGGAALFCGLGLFLATTLPDEFIPADDSSQTRVSLTLPPGSTLADTLALTEQASEIVRGNKHTRTIYTTVGAAPSSSEPGDEAQASSNVRQAMLTVTLSPRADRDGLSQQQVEQQFRAALAGLPGARVSVGGEGASESYELVLAADDGRVLAQTAAQVERELRTIPGIGAVMSSAGLVQQDLVVKPDFARAADLGVTSSAIAETLRVATAGDHDQSLAKLNLGERQVPVVVKLEPAARRDIDTLAQLPVPGARGPVALVNVASLEMGSGPSEITREDRRRNVSLTVELNGRPLGEIEEAVLALPSLGRLPQGVTHSASGDAEDMEDLTQGFGQAMLMGVLCIYVVLVLLLKDFVRPLTILMALVLLVPGAFFALSVTGSTLSMPAMIGLVMLMGIATKNSILLVDYAVIGRTQLGLGPVESVIDACRKRARPIVMTTLAMGAGMLPIALGWGTDPSFRAPMAIVVIGGLISSTFLSLLVIPVVVICVDDLVQWLRNRRATRPNATQQGEGRDAASLE